jgi:hypothetical protein
LTKFFNFYRSYFTISRVLGSFEDNKIDSFTISRQGGTIAGLFPVDVATEETKKRRLLN